MGRMAGGGMCTEAGQDWCFIGVDDCIGVGIVQLELASQGCIC